MSSHTEVENAAAVVRQHQENIEYLEPDRRHGEKVHRH
jgi:hypothetical protein